MLNGNSLGSNILKINKCIKHIINREIYIANLRANGRQSIYTAFNALAR